jgi:PPK2 family polyphosphate:nucleotide phosphotransferase
VAKPHTLHHTPFTVEPGTPAKLHKRDTAATPGFESKAEGKKALAEDIAILAEAQRRLWASRQHSVIVILQAMDAAGKDGAIRHVMSGVNPQGVDVIAFGPPTLDEKLHHFLWRPSRAIPARGRITIFNRSYYEEVLVVRVHPELLEGQWIPRPLKDAPLEDLWRSRYEDINRMESLWVANGTMILKFFLHLGYDEQRDRLLARLDDPAKNWSHVEVLDLERVLLDELAPGLDLLAHQHAEQRVGVARLLPRHAEHRPVRVVHRGLPELLGVHLAQPLEPLDLHPAPPDLVERWAGSLEVRGLDQLAVRRLRRCLASSSSPSCRLALGGRPRPPRRTARAAARR